VSVTIEDIERLKVALEAQGMVVTCAVIERGSALCVWVRPDRHRVHEVKLDGAGHPIHKVGRSLAYRLQLARASMTAVGS